MAIADVVKNAEELDNPIFVVGCPRSGTTVLARAIGLSESVCYAGETHLIPRYYTRRVPLASAVANWQNGEALLPILKGKARRMQERLMGKDYLRELILNMIRHAKITDYDLQAINGHLIDRYNIKLSPTDVKLADELYGKYTHIETGDIHRLLRIILKDFQIMCDKTMVLEKSPLHALYTLTLRRIFPRSRICFIARDGRDVAASYMLNYRERKIDNRRIRSICETHRRIRLIDETLSTRNDPGYYRVRYEDLVTKPAILMEGIFSFLGLPLSDRVLRALPEVRPTPSNWLQLPEQKQRYVEACLGLSGTA